MKINFNIPPYMGIGQEYIMPTFENYKICGDGEFTKKCSN